MIAIFILLAWYAVFRLPFRFPPSGALVSPSLVFGFNNALAIAGVLVLIGAVTGFRLWRRFRSPDRSAPLQWFSPTEVAPSERIRIGVFALMLAAHAGLTALMWVSTKASSTWRIDFEASHFLWRLQLMERFGARPYLDFQHEYGPALLYVPTMVHRLLAPAGIGLDASYYLSYFAASAVALWGIRVILDQANIPRPRKEIAFCLLAAAGLTPYMGLNGNLIRYVPPYLGMLLADTAVRRGHGAIRLFLVVSSFGIANILISPEIGAAFAVGWGAYCAFSAWTDPRRAILGLAGLAAAAALGALIVPVQYAGTVFSFSAGAGNFPLVPAAHIILYLTTVLVAVPALFAEALSHPGRPAALLFAMATVSVLMIPGALTRADPPHVLFFGLGVSLLLFIQTAVRSRRAFVMFAVVYTIVTIAGLHLSNARAFYDVSLRSFSLHDLVAFLQHREVEVTDDQIHGLSKYPPLGLPFCSYGTDRRTMAYLWARGQIDPEYYCGIIGVYTERQLARKLADTSRHQYLLVRKNWLEPLPEPLDPCRRHLVVIRRSFIYPGRLECNHESLEPDQAVSRTVVAQYRVVEELGPYVIMKRVRAP